MDWVDARDTFDLDNDRALDDQIDAITQIDSLAVIDHRKSYLSGNSESRLRSSCAKHASWALSSKPA
jgi:hypothetical protein